MRRKSWLLLAIIPVLFATYTLRRSPISCPAPAEGEEAPYVGTPADINVLFPLAPRLTQEDFGLPPDPVVAPVVITPALDSAASELGAASRAEQEELCVVVTYAAEERQKIEVWYSGQLTELKVWLDERLQNLDEVNKLAWAQFYQRANETWSMTRGCVDVSVHSYDYGYGYGSTHGYGSSSGTTQTFVRGNPAGDYAAVVDRLKDSKQATQQDFTEAQRRLAWMRSQKLAAVQAEVDRRKSVVALRMSRAQMEFRRNLSGDLTPRVNFILMARDGRLAISTEAGGAYEGDTIAGYRVLVIRETSVEFEKDGKTWVQKVE